jgi:hypothetical protein
VVTEQFDKLTVTLVEVRVLSISCFGVGKFEFDSQGISSVFLQVYV